MKSLSVIPHVGIGPLKLTMSPEQILDAINNLCIDLSIPNNGDMIISEQKEEEGFTIRYLGKSFFFMVQYKSNQAVEIAVNHDLKGHA